MCAECVGDAAGRHAEVVAAVAVRAVDHAGVGGQQFVVATGQAHEHTGERLGQGGRVDARVLEGFPCGFEEQTVLGVGGGGFPLADAEELGVEPGDVVEEAPPWRPNVQAHQARGRIPSASHRSNGTVVIVSSPRSSASIALPAVDTPRIGIPYR
jgi:hypothetical protein